MNNRDERDCGKGTKKVRSTANQLKNLVEYMIANPDLVKEMPTSPFSQKRIAKKWQILSKILARYGPMKSVTQWKITWRDLKRHSKEEFVKAKEQNKDSNNVSLMMSATHTRVLEALENATQHQIDNDGPWKSNPLWIDVDNYDENQGDFKDDPQFDVAVEYLEDMEEQDIKEDSQDQEEAEKQNDENGSDDEEDASDEEAKLRAPPGLPPTIKRPATTFTSTPAKLRRPNSIQPSPSTQNSTPYEPHYRDVDVLNTLNKFIEYEKDKDKLAHEREMTRIEQTNRMLTVLEKIGNVFESLAPSIKKTLERDGNGYR